MDNQRHQTLVKAAEFFVATLKKVVATEHGIHAETTIASAARMAGTMLFRSFGVQLKNTTPGTVVVSEQANTAGPRLMNVMIATLKQLGHNVTEQSMGAQNVTLKLSGLTLIETQQRLDPFYLAYSKAAPLSFEDAVIASAIASAILIHDCRQVLDVNKASALAVYAMAESSKTMPPHIEESPRIDNKIPQSR